MRTNLNKLVSFPLVFYLDSQVLNICRFSLSNIFGGNFGLPLAFMDTLWKERPWEWREARGWPFPPTYLRQNRECCWGLEHQATFPQPVLGLDWQGWSPERYFWPQKGEALERSWCHGKRDTKELSCWGPPAANYSKRAHGNSQGWSENHQPAGGLLKKHWGWQAGEGSSPWTEAGAWGDRWYAAQDHEPAVRGAIKPASMSFRFLFQIDLLLLGL